MLNITLSSTINEQFSMLRNMIESVSSRMTLARKTAGVSKAKLAEAVGVSRSVVTQWENGDVKSLRPENLFKVARALNCSPEWLGTGEGSRDPTGIIEDVIHEMDDSDRQAVFDFIEYKIERASNVIASQKIARYTKMMDKVKADMEKLKRQ